MFFLITINSKNEQITKKSNYYHDVYPHPIEEDHFLNEVFFTKKLSLKLDKGWRFTETTSKLIWYKGYSTELCLSDFSSVDSFDSRKGNYLCLVYEKDKDSLSVYRDTLPGFNIFYTEKHITNLYPTKHQVDFDELIAITSQHKIIIKKHPISINFQDSLKNKLSIKDTAHHLKDLLRQQIKAFFKYNPVQELELQFSGGLDTTLLVALLQDCSINFKYVDVRKEKSLNWKEGESELATHLSNYYWGFKQNNIYPEDRNIVVASGFWGDEFLMRNPLYVHWVLSHNHIDLLKEVSFQPDAYMSKFINHDYSKKINSNHKVFSSEYELYETLKEWCLRNYQINHLNNTIMFTPYKDLDILNLSFRMSNKAILSQAIDGSLQKEIIKSIDSSLLDELDQSKNNR